MSNEVRLKSCELVTRSVKVRVVCVKKSHIILSYLQKKKKNLENYLQFYTSQIFNGFGPKMSLKVLEALEVEDSLKAL